MSVRSFAVLAAVFAVALAQSSSSPLIPSGISTNCATYLTTLNTDAAFLACTNPYTTALQAFAPGSNSTSPSSSAVSSALNTLCSTNALASCPQSNVTAQLGSFYAACETELTSSPNQVVKTTYDVLYTMIPLRLAICAKDDSGNYCASDLSNTSSAGNVLVGTQNSQQAPLNQYLYVSSGSGAPTRRDASNATTVFTPNTTTYQDTNLLFLFLQPTLSNAQLCKTCTRNIITAYITYESNCPYGPGMSNSVLLAGQVDLYNNITAKCGSNFLSGAVQAAGGLSGGLVNSAVPRTGVQDLPSALSAILGVAALVAAAL